MNIHDLTKATNHLRLIHKYENSSIQQKTATKNEALFQFKKLKLIGREDKT